MLNLKKIAFTSLVLLNTLSAEEFTLTKKEKEYIDLNVVKVAMTPNLYPFKMLKHKKLESISFDILQLISKKSGLEFNYEVKDWFNNINPNQNNRYNKVPITIVSQKDLTNNLLENRLNKNIYIRDNRSNINKFETIDYFTLNLSFDDFDLIISPLLELQASILKNKYINKKELTKLRINKIHKDDIKFGVKENNTLLYSIIEKTFNSITNEEWDKLSKKWEQYPQKNALNTIFNENELTYIKNNNKLKICSVGNLAPIEFWDKNTIKGLSIDILNQINKSLNFELLYIKVKSFSDALESIENKKCDLILNNENNFKSKNITKETISIYTFDLAIITKKDIPVVTSLKSILNESIAIKKDSTFKEKIQSIYPSINFIETKNDYESLKLVSQGKANFTLSPHVIAAHYLSKYAINDLYISRYTNIPYKINMSVHLNNSILLDILNKSLLNIKKNEKKTILDKWINPPLKEAFDSKIFLYIGIFIFFISSIIIYRQKILKEYNKKLEKKVKEEIRKNELKTEKLIQQSKLAQMGELINMIAHQWRQPLTSITSVTNNLLLKEYYDNRLSKEKQIQELSLIIDYSKYMSNTIEDFQNLYKENKIKRIIHLEDVVSNAIKIIDSNLKKYNIEIKYKYLLKKELLTYPRELNQVILNLIRNSLDAFKNNKIKEPIINISTYEKESFACLSIKDNAGGIKEENINKIFNPYFSTKKESEGTGLGLYMSKIIIENNCKGKLEVKNTKDGVEFIILIKLNRE